MTARVSGYRVELVNDTAFTAHTQHDVNIITMVKQS
jgi:hypothetical protein